MKHLFLLIGLFISLTSFSKDTMFVCEDNGIAIKETPNSTAETIAFADYATEVTILEASSENEYVKVQFPQNMAWVSGYMLADSLTSNKLEKRLKVEFGNATLYVQNISINAERNTISTEDDMVTVDVFGDNVPFGKVFKVSVPEGYSAKIFQQTEQGFVFYSNNNFCRLDDWKTFKSKWKTLSPLVQENAFNSLQDDVFNVENEISVAEVKSAIAERCEASVANSIQPFKSLKENEIGLQTKKVHYKIELTDNDGNVTEKLVVFNLSIGC